MGFVSDFDKPKTEIQRRLETARKALESVVTPKNFAQKNGEKGQSVPMKNALPDDFPTLDEKPPVKNEVQQEEPKSDPGSLPLAVTTEISGQEIAASAGTASVVATTAVIPSLAPEKRQGKTMPKPDGNKVLISIRLSPEVVAWFRGTGRDWQPRLNDVLIEYVRKQVYQENPEVKPSGG